MNIKQLFFTMSVATSIFSSLTTVASEPPTGKNDLLLIGTATAVWMTLVYVESKFKKTTVKPETKPIAMNPK